MGNKCKPDAVELGSELIYQDNFAGFSRKRVRIGQHQGGHQDVDRLVLQVADTVAVLGYDPHADKVLLTREFGIGVMTARVCPVTLGLPSGAPNPGESLLQTARRELREETGLGIRNPRIVFRNVFLSGGRITERVSLIFGQIAAHKAGGVHGAAHESENIKTVLMPVGEFFNAVNRGRIKDLKTLAAGWWLQRHYGALRAKTLHQSAHSLS